LRKEPNAHSIVVADLGPGVRSPDAPSPRCVLLEADNGRVAIPHPPVEFADATVDVDTGFLVYNDRTYPLFCRLLDRLGWPRSRAT